MTELLIDARGVVVAYRSGGLAGLGRKQVEILHGVDLAVGRGEIVGIVGESGSGKTTLGRALLGLVKPVAGTIRFEGTDITALAPTELRHLRKRMQMIFQDPMSSLNARQTIRQIQEIVTLRNGRTIRGELRKCRLQLG